MLIRLQQDPIDTQEVIDSLKREIHGAVIVFIGTVRLYTEERKVRYLDYEAYPEMAEVKLREVAQEVVDKHQIEDISMVHRYGRLYVGEASLVVAVASLHRREGYDASLHTVERIKEVVPIWKKEVWDAGEVWVRSEGA